MEDQKTENWTCLTMEDQKTEKYLNNRFVYALENLVEFVDKLPEGCDATIVHDLKAARDTYCKAHELLVYTLVRACNIAHEYDVVTNADLEVVETSHKIMSNISEVLSDVLPQSQFEKKMQEFENI